jgi:hypothetical protein
MATAAAIATLGEMDGLRRGRCPMVALVSVPLALWLAAFVARPRRPLPGNEVQELVYSRLLGRYERLVLLALIVTGVMVIGVTVTLPRHLDTTLGAAHEVGMFCDDESMTGVPSCLTWHADGSWTREELRGGSGWQVVVTGGAGVSPVGG